MSATKQRITYTRAEAIAADITALLWPFVEQIEIAGSIRRRKPVVSDIELVCIPRIARTSTDLFGTVFTETDALHDACEQLMARGILAHRFDKNGRRSFGERYKRLLHVESGIALDLFCVKPPAQWGVVFAIRTGSAEFTQRFVTSALIGGALPAYMLVRDGCLYRHMQGADLPVDSEARRKYPAAWLVEVPTPTEREFFDAIGMDWVEPEARS